MLLHFIRCTSPFAPAICMDPSTLNKPPVLREGDVARSRRMVTPGVPPHRRGEKSGNWRKAFFRAHGWIGLNTGLLLFVICFSGSIATLSNEIDWLLNPAMRVAPQEGQVQWGAVYRGVEAAFPEGEIGMIEGPLGPRFAAMAYVEVGGQTRKVYVNPYTGAVQGHTSFFNVQRFFRSFHRQFSDGRRGIAFVTLFAFVLLVAGLTGFVFYKGWLKQLFTLRWGKGARLLWSDLHKGAGIWALVFTLVIAFTGVFYFVEVVFQSVDRYDSLLPPPLPRVEVASLDGFGAQPDRPPVEQFVAAAHAAYPGLRIQNMHVPARLDQPVYFDGQAGNPFTRDRADKVLLHPLTAEVIAVQRTGDLDVVPFVTDAVDPVHFGTFGGVWTKILWCVLGLMLSFSILSGTYLWAVRSVPARAGARAAVAPWLRGAPVAFALTLAYFVFVVFSTVREIEEYGVQDALPVAIAEMPVGPYQVRVGCTAPCRTGEGAAFTVRFLGEGMPSYAEAELAGTALEGSARVLQGVVTAPAGTALPLSVTTRDGAVHQAVFQAPGSISTDPDMPALPVTAPGVWWVIGAFSLVTAGFIAGWLLCLLRVYRRTQPVQ